MRHFFGDTKQAGAVLAIAAGFLCSMPTLSPAQEEADAVGGQFRENEIVGRSVALRLRGEVELTEDSDELIAENSNFALFPSRLYTAEAKLFQSDRSTYTVQYSLWQNDQEMDVRQLYWKAWLPLPLGGDSIETHLTVKYRDQRANGDTPDRGYAYLGIDRSTQDGLYSYLQYRHGSVDGDSFSHELYEYVSWKPTSLFRVGEQASVTTARGIHGLAAWYVGAFGTIYLVPGSTALRVDVRHFDSGVDVTFERYNAYLYQRVGNRSLLRLMYRLYDDNQDLQSQACGVKFKHYFSARLSGHVAYRYYDHSAGTDFDTYFAGLEILL